MSLRGLPDFQRPIQGDGWQILYPYAGGGSHVLVPHRLEVATRQDGRPDFLLEFVRGQHPLLPPAPYGVLDFRVRPQYGMEAALPLLRRLHPEARLAPASFTAGFLRLYPQGEAAAFPADLRQPVPLTWNGLTTGRYVLRLPLDSALLLKRALQEEVLPLFAQAEMEMVGVAPRLPLRVRFDPGQLLPALLARSDAQRRLARDDLLAFFASDAAALGLALDGEVPDPQAFAATMADWVRAQFGVLVAAPREDGQAYLRLEIADNIESGQFVWDLSQPLQTWRPLVLVFHPLEAARQVVQAGGLEAIVPPPVIVPPMPTGLCTLSVSANVPERRPGVLALGVTVRVPPRPPFRPQAIVQSVELSPLRDMATVPLRLAPTEPLLYTYSTFVIIQDQGGIRRLDGPESEARGDRLALTPDDFPVRFVPLEADRDLLELATVHGHCRWTEGEVTVAAAWVLDQEHPALALPLPREAEEATLEIEARPHQEGRVLRLGPLPMRPLSLGLSSFPEYGPHQISIEGVFDDDAALLVLDLLPEDQAETAAGMSVLALSPRQARKEWSYLASSPFRAGYRYRRHAGVDGVPGPWSEVRSPFAPLVLATASIHGVPHVTPDLSPAETGLRTGDIA